jgi:hypothetical protein
MWITPRRFAMLAVALAIGSTVSAAAAGATTSARADLPAPTTTSPVTGSATARPDSATPPTLVGVRYGRHERYDRTVFDFTGGTPGFRVEYGSLYEQGRGNLVPLAGAATLRVVFTGAFAYDVHTGRPTIDLSQVLNPRFPTLRQIKFGGAFEGRIGAGLGLADRVGFRVLRLTDPPRVAVDVAHQPTQPFGTGPFWGGGLADEVSISGVRSGRHPGYDRLVFDLRGTDVPLVSAGYVRGTASTINVGFTGLSLHATVSGPQTVRFGLPQLRGVSFTVYENGTVSARVTTTSRHGFRVMLLRQPTRVVLDVAY